MSNISIYRFALDMTPGGVTPVVHLSQYDDAFQLEFTLYSRTGELNIPSGATAMIEGTKLDGKAYSANAAISGNVVTVTGDVQISAVAGNNPFQIVLKSGNSTIGSANFTISVERAALDYDTVSDSKLAQIQDISGTAAQLTAAAENVTDGVETFEALAESVSDMLSDIVDDTLSISGKAADAAKTGEELSNLKSDIYGGEKSITLEKGSFMFSQGAIVWQNGTIRCRTPQGTFLQLYAGDVISSSNNVVVSCSRVDANFNRLEIIGETWNTEIEIATPGRYVLLLQYSDATSNLTAETAMQSCVLTSTGVRNELASMVDPTLEISGKAADAAEVGAELNIIKSDFNFAADIGRKQIFSGTVSGTKFVGTQMTIPAGTYVLSINSIVSSDTDDTQCVMSFVLTDNTSVIYYFDRGTSIKTTLTLPLASTIFYCYAAKTAQKSEGDTFSFTDVLITGSIAEPVAETARDENKYGLIAIGNGQYLLDNLQQGQLSSDYVEAIDDRAIHHLNSVVSVGMECYCPAYPNSIIYDKHAKPLYLNKGDAIKVASGYRAFLYCVEPVIHNGETYWRHAVVNYPSIWIEQTTFTLDRSGLYFVGRITKMDPTAHITVTEGTGAVTLLCNNGVGKRLDKLENAFEVTTAEKSLNRNPYPTDFDAYKEVISTTHCHCENDTQLAQAAVKYEHVCISNYYPSAPWYPLEEFYESIPEGFIASPNGEQAHFTGSATGVHLCSVGSYLSRDTTKYGGTLYDCIADTVKMLQFVSGGGVTINHPTYSNLSGANICDILDNSKGVFAMEIYNSNTEALETGKGMALDQWDDVLATGRQIFGVAAPDHEVQLRPNEDRIGFGYCHVLVRAKTEQEILVAYRAGRFYSSVYNDNLKFANLIYTETNGLVVETSVNATIKIITANGVVKTETNTNTATYTATSSDVYIRVEATDGTNTLWSNAIIL